MRSMVDMDTIQIELTNLCRNACSNCTRFAGHREPFMMPLDQVKEAIDSMVGYPKMTGIQGGEPLLHPEFQAICAYLREKIPYEQLGLWTTLPKGFEHYREDIVKTFKHIFLNDHTRPDVFHHPPLVAIEELIKDEGPMWYAIDHCWAQRSWSASIYPNGAWFCEIAGSMSMLFAEEGRSGWPVEPGWWWKIPADFREQMDFFCRRCGFPAKIRRRTSVEGIDDISPGNFKRMESWSRKIARGKYELYDFDTHDDRNLCNAPMASYKDTRYRDVIAHRYGMFVMINDQRFWTAHLIPNWKPGEPCECSPGVPTKDLYKKFWPQEDQSEKEPESDTWPYGTKGI